MRTASNAPGARPASPYAARSLSVPNAGFQKGSSESTYDALTFGYVCSPKSLPNALLPSTRAPAVRNSLSRKPNSSCTNTPALITFCRVSNPCRAEPLDTVGTGMGGRFSAYPSTSRVSTAALCPPHDSVDLRLCRGFHSQFAT